MDNITHIGIRIKIEFCSCYSEVEGLIKLGYFPATPKFPTMAFSFIYFESFIFGMPGINPRLCTGRLKKKLDHVLLAYIFGNL